jgi:predicted nuclease with TOPRIM domain
MVLNLQLRVTELEQQRLQLSESLDSAKSRNLSLEQRIAKLESTVNSPSQLTAASIPKLACFQDLTLKMNQLSSSVKASRDQALTMDSLITSPVIVDTHKRLGDTLDSVERLLSLRDETKGSTGF